MAHKGIIERREESGSRPRGRPFKKGENGKTKTENPLHDIHIMGKELVDKILESDEGAFVESTPDETKELELIESIDFKNGENKLSIRFSKKHNRMFRIQIFLNDKNEIRPVTYSGASTGKTFWSLLKGVLK